MCGHDWCSMRISKEIVAFASGKDPAFQPERRSMRSPGIGAAGRDLLAQRGTVPPVVSGKHACHSELIADEGEARRIQADAVSPSVE
jgi:phosphomethylpyrimidine synthase